MDGAASGSLVIPCVLDIKDNLDLLSGNAGKAARSWWTPGLSIFRQRLMVELKKRFSSVVPGWTTEKETFSPLLAGCTFADPFTSPQIKSAEMLDAVVEAGLQVFKVHPAQSPPDLVVKHSGTRSITCHVIKDSFPVRANFKPPRRTLFFIRYYCPLLLFHFLRMVKPPLLIS